MTLQQKIEELNKYIVLHEKADVPSDMRVDEDYLNYGDSITIPSVTGLHRVHITSANEVDMTTDCCRFFVEAANHSAKIASDLVVALEMLKDISELNLNYLGAKQHIAYDEIKNVVLGSRQAIQKILGEK